MDIHKMSETQIEKLTPAEFRDLIIEEFASENSDDEEDDDTDINEVNGEMIEYLGKKVILLADTCIDGGYDLPCLRHTYNLKKLKSLPDTGSYGVDIYEKIDSNKSAYAFYSSAEWKELVKV